MENNEEAEQGPQLPKGISPYRWFIGLLADGTYRFITPYDLQAAEKYIGKHGGAIYTHAGYLVFAANHRWYEWLTDKYEEEYANVPSTQRPPHINVPEIDCTFSPSALQWLQENESLLQEQERKFYENIPRH